MAASQWFEDIVFEAIWNAGAVVAQHDDVTVCFLAVRDLNRQICTFGHIFLRIVDQVGEDALEQGRISLYRCIGRLDIESKVPT